MLGLPDERTIIGDRIRSSTRCRSRFKGLVALLDTNSIPTVARAIYDKWMAD